MALDGFVVGLLLAGLTILSVVVFTQLVSERALSLPIIYLAFGAIAFTVAPALPFPDPIEHADTAERLTELGVIIALMGAGLKLDRRVAWPDWESTARLLAITMPLSIAGAALLGWWVAGLLLPTAVLLGAVIAPTDPVLAAEIQVPGPGEGMEAEPDPDGEGLQDEVRFALTSEAGLNDGLAFPFTYLAILLALVGYDPSKWLGEWLLVFVAYKLVVGLVGGVVVGWLVALVIFRFTTASPLSRSLQGLEAVAGTLIAYAAVELVGGYGFIAVFVAAMTIREYERHHEYHDALHSIAEMAEYLLMVGVMVLFGGALVDGLLAPLTWEAVLVAVGILFVVRPLAGVVGLLGFDRPWRERIVISVFGIRGIGSFYYLSFALNTAPFRNADLLWALVGLIVLLSVVVHGIAATPAMNWLEANRDAN
ncbi:cation:proton antiporter [Halobacteria archaeon AArc-m2/3/4]|uniref:Cation:proton antiporter n=1 Tax=Natronoglomus mannanivorans TaxID=2979990 RepID=A0AAP3E0K0_9EURY|nr:cation:proton antiporter [Halobacteria archaeon AArc-xg1-1]MCU4971720.1 cation:proton antiporter [Halobacteria archaeon AArc-m2/3/4]